MIKFTISLPIYKYGITIAPRKRRGDKTLRLIEEVASVRNGSKISRFARLVLHKSRIQKYLGIGLVTIIVLSNVFPPAASVEAQVPAETIAMPASEAPVATTVVRRYPVNDVPRITQGYRLFHPAIDIDGLTGDPIYPFTNGKVSSAGQEFFLGNTVRVEHPDNTESVYAHLSKINVKGGDEVDTKTKLGEMGNTGRSFGDHLHFEVYKNGVHVNPATVLPQEKVTQVNLPQLSKAVK